MLFEYIQLPNHFLEMKMKIAHLLASVAILATTGSAFAAMDITGHFEDHTDFTSSKTRSEVRAELAQAQAQNLVVRNDADDVNASEIKRIESNTGARSLAGSRDSKGDQAPRPVGG
jgi:16S rRNA C1402 (ribose-2'-O) methylase RsmI